MATLKVATSAFPFALFASTSPCRASSSPTLPRASNVTTASSGGVANAAPAISVITALSTTIGPRRLSWVIFLLLLSSSEANRSGGQERSAVLACPCSRGWCSSCGWAERGRHLRSRSANAPTLACKQRVVHGRFVLVHPG